MELHPFLKEMVKLTRAGFRSPLALQVFYFIKTLLMIFLPLTKGETAA